MSRVFMPKLEYLFKSGQVSGEFVYFLAENSSREQILECYHITTMTSYYHLTLNKSELIFWKGTITGSIIGMPNKSTIYIWTQGNNTEEPILTVSYY